ncbi:MAG: hypothetical protein CMD22_01195, partial [Flavobacteriales bacterium]|nr:hypothetical protein [Flavobacteriales bacterium]
MKKHISYAFIALLFSSTLFAQNITELENVKNLIREDFNDSESAFPILTNVDNYFIIDNGDYLLSRNNTETEYAILASTKENINNFTLKSSIKLGPSSYKRSSAGLLIKAQSAGSGALVFEINRKGEFRIKELLISNTYKYLSGKNSNDGWVKNREIKGEGDFNAIEIRCKENVYDIYVNNKFITTFFSPNISSGKMGILIGRDAKARFAYYYLDIPTETENNLITEHMNDFNVTNLTNKVKQLESEKITLTNSNTRLEKEVESLKSENSLKLLEESLNKASNSLDSSLNIISNLSSDLEAANNILKEDRKNLQSANTELEKGNKMISEFSVKQKELTSKISILEAELSDLNKQVNSKQNRLDNQIELNKELQSSNVKLNTKINETESKNKNLKSEVSSLKNKNLNTSSSLKSEKEKTENLNNKVSETSKKLKEAESKNSSLQDKVNKLNSKVSSLNSEISALNSKLSKEKSNSATVSKDLRKKLTEKTNEVNSLNSKLSSLKKKYSSQDNLEVENIQLKQSVKDKEESITTLISKVAELEKSIKELEIQNNTLTKSESNKSEEIKLLTSTVEDLYTKVENMKEVLIYKGFEEKGIQSENVTTTKVANKSTKKNIKKKTSTESTRNLTYSVQIATYGAKVNINQFIGLKDVFYIDSENQTFLYMSGKFYSSNDAIEHRNKLV